MTFTLIFIVAMGLGAYTGDIPLPLLLGYLVMSGITFTLYALDKAAARKGQWRTAERTLHLFALVGGWPGAVMAQQWLRHKSLKRPFRQLFWLTVVLNLLLAVAARYGLLLLQKM